MAGSINLSLSQQFDKLNGNLLSGGRLYFYAAGTDAPQNAFKDTNLTLVHPNPIILASDGRIPQLYFADGSIHVRLTDNGGVVQFDEDFILVIGPSSGGGGGGGGVDPTAIFRTSFITWLATTGSLSGWVRLNGKTIGSALSGATERANADCQALFEALWNGYDNATCPVSGGRTTAVGDWSANKTIGLLDFREIIIGGLSDMGNSDRGGFSAVPVERGGRTIAGGIIGEITHTLADAEMPFHAHSGTTDINNVDHSHGGGGLFDAFGVGSAGTSGSATATIITVNSTGSAATDGESNPHQHTFTSNATGSGVYHNTTPRTMLGTFYMKL